MLRIKNHWKLILFQRLNSRSAARRERSERERTPPDGPSGRQPDRFRRRQEDRGAHTPVTNAARLHHPTVCVSPTAAIDEPAAAVYRLTVYHPAVHRTSIDTTSPRAHRPMSIRSQRLRTLSFKLKLLSWTSPATVADQPAKMPALRFVCVLKMKNFHSEIVFHPIKTAHWPSYPPTTFQPILKRISVHKSERESVKISSEQERSRKQLETSAWESASISSSSGLARLPYKQITTRPSVKGV